MKTKIIQSDKALFICYNILMKESFRGSTPNHEVANGPENQESKEREARRKLSHFALNSYASTLVKKIPEIQGEDRDRLVDDAYNHFYKVQRRARKLEESG